ncbi:Dual-specificity kinase, spindle pole body (SPB) duplication and spindle checkpoint function [Coemansia interrupta]|uniref:Dual-specificity kinase, spindle pole body (SPB) duplication and spindle checkpoint function n=1 Tax=Coemansia interrupta TaxID=1126814 RepID=A0A9W8HJS6_9FUNG|nr:Dual-specificity kinase, spindle pole body (SPB) duplication and spindle checkpoint function [Coemansia interrupta]
MSAYSYNDVSGGQSPKRLDQRPLRSLYPSGTAATSSSKLFALPSDDPDNASSISDLENTNFATSMLSASTTAFTRPSNANINASRESVEMADVSPPMADKTEKMEKTEKLPGISRYQELTTALRSYQEEQKAGEAAVTPAFKLPPHPAQGSTVTSRWKRRGRLGLAKPRRADSASQSEENLHANTDHTGFTDELMPAPIDFAPSAAGASAGLESSAERLRSSGTSVFTGSVESDMGRSTRSSFLSMDDHGGEHDQTFYATRLRSKNPSMTSTASESLRAFTQQPMYAGSRSMDASDVSMNSNPRSRSHSPDPSAATAGGSAKSKPGGVSLGVMFADEINEAGKRIARSRAADDGDYANPTDVQPGGDSARRRALSPEERPGALSPRLTRASPGFALRPAVSAPGSFPDQRSSPRLDVSPVDHGPRYEQNEGRPGGVSPQYRSPRQRPRLPASTLRASDAILDAGVAAGDDAVVQQQQQQQQQHAMSEPKPHRQGPVKLQGGSSSARAAERFVPGAGGAAQDGRPEFLGAGHASSPRLQLARRAEGGFEALKRNSPVPDSGVGAAQKGSEERGKSAMGLPPVEDKAMLQKEYLAAVALQQQMQQQQQQQQQQRQPPSKPEIEQHQDQHQHSTHQSQHQHQYQHQQLHTPLSHPQPPSQLQPQPQAQIQTQSHPQSQAQQQPARNGMDPKRTLIVNGRAYQKISITGRGGSSKVYKAMSTKHEIFAIKRVSFSRADVQTIEGYVNEIMLLRRFEGNPHIIQLFDAEITKERGLLHMVMEFGETDLANVLKRQGDRPLGMNMIRLYWEQMLRAVQTIHEERVVHADLKPANYLLVRGSLKLIDFGIAKAIGNDTTNIHRENQVGTVNYMSPEAIKETNTDGGKRLMKLGRASDIWSLGIILYQMCYGRTPFAQLALFQKLASIPDPNVPILFPQYMAGCLQVGTERDPNMDPSPRYPDGTDKVLVPPDLMRVMKYCLQRDPEKRMTIPDLLVDMFLCPMSLEQALPSAMSQMLSLLKKNPQVLEQWDVSEAQNEKMLAYLTRTLGMQEQGKQA